MKTVLRNNLVVAAAGVFGLVILWVAITSPLFSSILSSTEWPWIGFVIGILMSGGIKYAIGIVVIAVLAVLLFIGLLIQFILHPIDTIRDLRSPRVRRHGN